MQLPQNATVLDVFGGSGLVAHTIKHQRPDLRVVWNDFDNYHRRLELIPKTNEILEKLREVIQADKSSRLESNEPVLGVINQYTDENIDWITLSSAITFTGQYVTNRKQLQTKGLYNCIPAGNYCAKGYLEGVERVQSDYADLIEEFDGIEGLVIVADPPYLSTDADRYYEGKYWTLAKYLNVIKLITQAEMWIYFTSEKSHLVELFDSLEKIFGIRNPLQGHRYYTKITPSGNGVPAYQDIMVTNLPKPIANEDGQLYLCDDFVG